ncbi:Ig-like domain-containing protein [Paenibacillus sp. HN-1]|uniref:Ig-like domain-containing protein n=1 Tax=Paenibacillus TaxID=44249 RepID=UPI001CA9E31F|nr:MULTISPECIES: Ig-like domain-containing protein [Paenibacillus]MBY9078597.1 Ig-like domain-containing protein [Paenibacillus sp. CGMCC 1.18879]MBY9084133.1 Ig-like domain-containing protein [Paenibacillus sinensis]
MKWTRNWACVLVAALLFTLTLGSTGPLGALSVFAADAPGANLDFEAGSLTDWTAAGTAAVQTAEAHGGSYSAKLSAASSTLTRTITGIEQGSYTLSAWVKGGTSSNSAYITATETGGPDTRTMIDTYISNTEWKQISMRNVLIYNGQVKITIASGTGNNLAVDDIELTLDSSDANPLVNWSFETGDLGGWTIDQGSATAGAGADTGTVSAVLGADSQLSQTVAVEPNTTYIATVRAKVDRQDTWETIYQKNYLGNTGQLVNVTSYGDRVNLGVKTADGKVLRQAPSGTAGYSLVTLRFKTGPNDHQVTVYANTIKDAEYDKSVATYTSSGANGSHDEWQGNGADKAYVDNFDLFAIDNTTVKGADVSFLPIIEDNGGKYFANGVQQDCLTILANHGVNAITGMLFVHAGNPVYDQSTVKQMQYVDYYTDEDGNPYPLTMQAGYFDKTHAYTLAKRAQALDIGYMPGFHFSDTWMSAGKAFTPYDWMYKDSSGKLVDQSLDEMTTTMYNYVYDFIKGLADQGTVPMGVKIGNEQDGGIAWPTGKGYSSAGYKALINAAYDAVHDAAPGVSAFIHSNNGYTPSNSNTQYGTFKTNGVKFDGQAYSLYSGHTSDAILSMLTNNIAQFPNKDYLDVETGYSFTKYNPDWADESGSMGQTSYYAASNPNGQYNWLLDYMQAMRDVANPNDRMRGFFYWETDWIVVEGAGASTGAPNTVDRRTMFNNGDTSIKEMGSTAGGKMGDMMDSMYAYLWRGHAKNKPATMLSPLQGFGTYSVTKTEPTSITLDRTSLSLTAGTTDRLLPTIAPDSNASSDKKVFDSTLVWSSSDPAVAEVNASGYVIAHQTGTAVITAKTLAGGLTASSTVTVAPASTAGSGNLTLTVGGTAAGSTVNAVVWDKLVLKGTLPAGTTDQRIIFRSSDPSVASFLGEFWQSSNPGTFYQQSNVTQNVKLNVKHDGTTTVTAESVDGTALASFTLNATKIPVTSVTLNKTSATVSLGRTEQLTATVAPANASFADVTWSSSAPDVASVDANGLVTTLTTGTTTITATSVDDPAIHASAVINVVPVMVTGLMLDKSALNLMIGTTRPITAVVSPDDAYNKTILWSSSDESVAMVDSAGRITGHKEGTATVTAVTQDGGYTRTVAVNVQSTPVAVTGVALDQEAYYFASDFFSSTNPASTAPTVQLKATVLPEDATNLDIAWSSNNPSIASVDAFGVVTARKAGTAVITATTGDGGFNASTTVYVPAVSESFDNRNIGDNWSVTAGSASAIGAAVASPAGASSQLLQLTAGGSGARAAYKSFNLTNNKIVLDFDWNVGSPSSGTGQLRIQDSAHNNYLTFGVPTGASSSLLYSTSATLTANTALTGTAVASSGFATANTTYHVTVTLDMTAKKSAFTLTNKATSQTVTVSDLPFASGTSFSGSLGYLEIYATRVSGGSMSWTSQFDNFNVYAAAPVASSVTLDHSSVSLLDIPGTPGNTAQLKATVNPNVTAVDQSVVWTTSDASVATVSSSGLVTAVSDGIVTVTATSVSDPSLSASASVSVHPIIPVEAIGINDDHGQAIDQTAVELDTGSSMQLKAILNPSTADVRSLIWSSSDPAVASIDSGTGLLTALTAGDAVITLTVDAYPDHGGYTGATSFNLHVTGEAVIDLSGLQSAIDDAIAAKTAADTAYTADSLSVYKTALSAAQTVLAQAQAEHWNASRQSEADEREQALRAAVTALAYDSSQVAESVQVSPSTLKLTAGLSANLTAEVLPVYVNDKVINWSSDNEAVAMVDDSGRVTAIAAGTANIRATAVNGGAVGSAAVTVSTDLSGGYVANGGSVSASKLISKYPLSSPIDNAATMNATGTAWSTGANLQTTATPEYWQIDLGRTARIDSFKMSFWQTMKYSLLVSDNGSDWQTVYDSGASYAGSASTIFDLQLPESAYGRYIRLNIYGVSTTKDWVGVTVFQANGAFVADPDGISVDPATAALAIGSTVQLQPLVLPVVADPRVSWTSSDEAIAKVDESGVVTAVGAGQANITASTVNGKTFTVPVTVKADAVAVTGVSLDRTELSLATGGSSSLTAIIEPLDAANQKVTWSSSDDEIVTVDEDGVVTAKAAGTATITVTTEDGGFTAETIVTVTDTEPETVAVTGVSVNRIELSLATGGSGRLTATIAPANATNQNVVWSSSDSGIAAVDNSGIVTAKAAGTATITVTTEDGGFTAETIVTVTDPAPEIVPTTGVSVNPTELSLTTGGSGALTATVAPANATNQNVVWSSSNSEVASVDAVGVVTAKSAGTATITATTEDGSFTAQTVVTVTAAGSGSNENNGNNGSTGSTTTSAASSTGSVVSTTGGVTTVTAKPDSNGNVTVSLTESELRAALQGAANGQLQIEIVGQQAAGKLEVALPAQPLLQAADQVGSITIRSGGVGITLATDDAAIFGQNAQTLSITVTPVTSEGLTGDAKLLIGEHPVYDLDLMVDGAKVPAFPGKGSVKVAFDYTPKAGELASLLVIYYIGENGQKEVVKNGVYAAASGRMQFSPQHFGRYAVAYADVKLGDLDTALWAKDMIQSLAARQIIQGTSAGSFEPGRSVTRAEFLQMLVTALGLSAKDAQTATTFRDIPADAWYEDAVAAGTTLGIVKGKADGTFGANETITREDMAVMLSRAVQAAGITLGVKTEAQAAVFTDQAGIAGYAVSSVAGVQQAGLITGFEDGSFRPESATTRAQAAAVIYKLLNL